MTNPPKFAAQLAAVVAGMLAALPAPASAEVFVDFGLHSTRVEADIAALPDTVTSTQSGIHLGAGLRRELTRAASARASSSMVSTATCCSPCVRSTTAGICPSVSP